MFKTVGLSMYYQTLYYSRVKEALFFILVFPAFLFVVFGSLWGGFSEDYTARLLSGVIATSVLSDGIFSIGQLFKRYYSSGLIKVLKKKLKKEFES